jgi:hypothetical protein
VVIKRKALTLGKFGERTVEIALQRVGNHYVANCSTCRAHQVMMVSSEVFG